MNTTAGVEALAAEMKSELPATEGADMDVIDLLGISSMALVATGCTFSTMTCGVGCHHLEYIKTVKNELSMATTESCAMVFIFFRFECITISKAFRLYKQWIFTDL